MFVGCVCCVCVCEILTNQEGVSAREQRLFGSVVEELLCRLVVRVVR